MLRESVFRHHSHTAHNDNSLSARYSVEQTIRPVNIFKCAEMLFSVLPAIFFAYVELWIYTWHLQAADKWKTIKFFKSILL